MTAIKRKHILLAIIWLGMALIGLGLLAIEGLAATLPEPSQEVFVYDETGQLSGTTKEHIISSNQQYELRVEKPQIAVALVNTLADLTVEQYANELFNKWGIGSAGHDNGLLLLLAPSEGEIRIEVGYGLERSLTDNLTGRILDKNINLLKEKEFDQAIYEIYTALAVKVNQTYSYANEQIFSSQLTDISHYEEVVTPPAPSFNYLEYIQSEEGQKRLKEREKELNRRHPSSAYSDGEGIAVIVVVIIGFILMLLNMMGLTDGGGSDDSWRSGGSSSSSSGGSWRSSGSSSSRSSSSSSRGGGSSFGGGRSGGGGSSRKF